MVATVGIGYSRERGARGVLDSLRGRILLRTQVLRDGVPRSVPSREVVPGDVVLLSAGSLVPADGVLLEATHCFVNEAVLTGESFPTEKRTGPVAAEATLRGQEQVAEVADAAVELRLRRPQGQAARDLAELGGGAGGHDQGTGKAAADVRPEEDAVDAFAPCW